MTRTHVEVSIAGDQHLLDHLVGLLSQIGFEGFWEDQGTLRSYIGGERWSPHLQTEVERVVGLVTRPSVTPRPVITVRRIEEENWNAAWERTIRPIHVSPAIVIRPTWQEYAAAPGEIVLIIDPKMSFGTGYHETTRLMLRLMERRVTPGMTVLDVGTGTGVLAIAAVRLGAARAVGTDIDEWASVNALENAALNGVTDRVTVVEGELDRIEQERFGMVAANIQRQVLEELLPELAQRLEAEGVLLLSGLLEQDEDPMRKSLLREGFAVEECLRENEWIALAARRRPPG